MVTAKIMFPQKQIAEFCKRWNIVEMALLGSVVRDDFRPDSDIDVLVTFAPGTRRTLEDYMEMEEELHAIFGRKVDLIERRLVEQSDNYIRRRHILNSAQVIYVA